MRNQKASYLNFLLLFYLLGSFSAQAQEEDAIVISYEDYIAQILAQHPLVRQIKLAEQRADLNLMFAKGEQLDPKLEGKWSYKQFGGKNYFNIYDGYLKIPTLLGIDVKAGYNGAQGYYLNPENTLPAAGQAYLGVSIPLLQGLWNNERQTALRSAKLMQSAADAEIKSALNNLLYEAAKAYWEWALAYKQTTVLRQSLDLSTAQLAMIRSSYLQGDLPAIDTLKAFIRIQDFNIQLNEAELDMRKARWLVENHLWLNDTMPASLTENTFPIDLDAVIISPVDSTELENWLAQIDQHPDLQLYQFQLKGLEIEQRFKATKLLPKAELSYNFLSANHVNFFEGTGGIGAVTEHYKLELKLSYPILIRKERADLQLNKLKQRETTLKMDFKKQELSNKVKSYFNEVETYAGQIDLVNAMVNNYNVLVAAEEEKYRMGESDIFIVNMRQSQFVEAQIKRYKTLTKYLKAQTAWVWVRAGF